MVLVAAL